MFCFFKQKTAYELRISDWSSDVCSSDLPSEWIRQDGAFPAIVSQAQFDQARLIVEERSKRLTDDEMLALLSDILKRNGYLSGLLIDEFEDGPSSSAYQSRFGSLLRAYSLIGFIPHHDYRYIEINRA